MQEIKKRRIVIASVLKPVDDTRMTEKIGKSLAATNEVHIIGYPSTTPPSHSSLTFHPLPSFQRLSLRRITAPWKILAMLVRLKASLLIITTHELLFVAVIVRMLTGCRIVYDVQENYFRNLLHTRAFPLWLRPLLAIYVRMKEYITSLFIHHFLLAEKGYEREITFPGKRGTVIENKYKPSALAPVPRKHTHDQKIHLLFSGTLAESTGVFTAIQLAEALHTHDAMIRLTIIGYCAQDSERQRLRGAIQNKPFIELKGGDTLVPHEDILKEIVTSDFGIISYPPNLSTVNSIPTKLYEYLGNKLPILMVHHSAWASLCEPYQAAIIFDDPVKDAEIILEGMREGAFYVVEPVGVLWDSEERKLIEVVSHLTLPAP